MAALLFFFVIPSYWARENIAAAIQQANIDFTGAIWFGGLLLCAWLILLRTAKQPRPVQVMTAGAVSLLIFFCIAESIRFLIRHQALSAKIWETGTFWTLAALLISSPVAFVVWRFRDENQSKDINLKEFQKISE
ncbi:MAG: hypothetical protein Q4E77_09045, partial [Conchiformibius sp.]|nr:hypothetical protein [Conchiformibius sp.]